MNHSTGIRLVSVRHRNPRGSPRGGRGIQGAPGTALLLHALLSIFMQFVWYLLPDDFGGLDKRGLTGYVAAIVWMQGVCVLLPAMLAVWWHAVPTEVVIGRRRPGMISILTALALGVPAAVMLVSLNNIAVYLMARVGMPLPAAILPADYPSSGLAAMLLLLAVSALLPALLEEMLFRGVIQGGLGLSGGAASAVLLTAIAFSLYHGDPLFLAAPFGAGVILGVVRRQTDHLFPCIAAHFSLNASIRLIRPILPRLTTEYLAGFAQTVEPVLYASIAAFFLSAAVVIPLTLMVGGLARRENRYAPRAVSLPADWKFWLAILLLVATIVMVYWASQATPTQVGPGA